MIKHDPKKVTDKAVRCALHNISPKKRTARNLASSMRRVGFKGSDALFRAAFKKHCKRGGEIKPANEQQELDLAPEVNGTMSDPAARRVQVSSNKSVRRYVFTCAQNNTELIPPDWWAALMHLVHHYDAELHVSQFTYNKSAYGKKSVKPGSSKNTDTADLFYAKEIMPYVSNEDLQIAPDLVWLGSANLIPTLVNPITGWQNHTRGASCILPHTKLAMESVPTMKHDPARFVYTTGAVTQRNYIQKAAGQKADFHHVFGAVLVEVQDNDWWVRQLNFDSSGHLYDLTHKFTADGRADGAVRALVHGDIHGYKMNKAVISTVFNSGGLLDALHPEHQFFHDLIDFMPRNHHNRKSFAFLNEMHRAGTGSVWGEFRYVAEFLRMAARVGTSTHVVVSNHDQAINNWLDDPSGMYDAQNSQLWFEQNAQRIKYPGYHAFYNVLCQAWKSDTRQVNYDVPPHVILEDESFKLDNVEFGLHGHLGPNGARGAPRNLRVVGKANTGHTHSAGIVEGVYTAGVLGSLDMGYNKGPSSWSHSSVVQYGNGKRAILTYRAGKWML